MGIKIVNSRGIIFAVLLTPDNQVEFYDCRYPFTDLGQFVARYDRDTITLHPAEYDLVLDTASPDWTVSPQALGQVVGWLSKRG